MGLAATFSVEFSLSSLEPVGGFGSELFDGFFAKYFYGQWVGLAAKCSVAFSLSTLGPVGGFGSDFFGGIFAKYSGASV